jgi:hypothetical protein
MKRALAIGLLLCATAGVSAQNKAYKAQVVIVGGGAGGAAAAIQSARSGAKTLLVEATPWLGGMLTAAGVGCTDGNHALPSGIWNELREAAYKHYGTRNLATGWVSNFNIEPHVGDSILKSLAAAEANLTIWFNTDLQRVKTAKTNNGAKIVERITVSDLAGNAVDVVAPVFVDATDLGDLLAAAGGSFDVGLEADASAGEVVGITSPANIVQDLTYAAILKDFGAGADKTIAKPSNYNPAEFDCACSSFCSDTAKLYSKVNAQKMLEYGKMPNGKYMINWPSRGNDFYTNLIGRSPMERAKALDSAKQKTLRFVYFIQTTLGFKHLGLATDEFATPDKLPYIAYHREGRRAVGLTRLTIPHIQNPYDEARQPLYKTGISVGDYPIDHHHREYGPAFPDMHFPPVPSYNIPAGSLISKNIINLLVADKVISVSNAANGTTRLQPVVMVTGQAAGEMAAQCALQNKMPAQLSVRGIQNQLLASKAHIMPFIDVLPSHPHWAAVQRVGVAGWIRGVGQPNAWANRTWFYPNDTLKIIDLHASLPAGSKWLPSAGPMQNGISVKQFVNEVVLLAGEKAAAADLSGAPVRVDSEQPITRIQAAFFLDALLRPFEAQVDWNGNPLSSAQLKK